MTHAGAFVPEEGTRPYREEVGLVNCFGRRYLALGGEHGFVEVDEVEEGLGRGVVVPPLRRLEVLRRCMV